MNCNRCGSVREACHRETCELKFGAEVEVPKTLGALWEHYKNAVLLPSGMNAESQTYMQGAFFSGVLSTMGFFASLDEHSEPVAQAMYEAWENELEQWMTEKPSVEAGKDS